MRIRKFNESEEVELSPERLGEIVESLRESLDLIDSNNKKMDAYLNELNNYKNSSKKGNDQIDDSISALQIIKSNLVDSVDKIDTVIGNLINYEEEGRKHLYSED